jgi:hypothetical protein
MYEIVEKRHLVVAKASEQKALLTKAVVLDGPAFDA